MKKAIIPVIAVLGILIGAYLLLNPAAEDTASSQVAEASATGQEAPTRANVAAIQSVKAQIANVNVGDNQTIKGIGLGDSSAQVVIHEFSSYSCGHCGTFHKTAFKDIQREYLATGDAYLVLSDFPLNLSALEASMISQCVPLARFPQFSQLLFENQGDWAYEGNHRAYLTQNAQLMGLPADQAQACLDNETEREAIAANAKIAQEVYNIRSTPSFVIYNKDNPEDRTIISGAHKFEVFQEAINKYLN